LVCMSAIDRGRAESCAPRCSKEREVYN